MNGIGVDLSSELRRVEMTMENKTIAEAHMRLVNMDRIAVRLQLTIFERADLPYKWCRQENDPGRCEQMKIGLLASKPTRR